MAERHVDQEEMKVIVQVLACSGEMLDNLDPEAVKMVGRPDSGEHQQLSGTDSTRVRITSRVTAVRCRSRLRSTPRPCSARPSP